MKTKDIIEKVFPITPIYIVGHPGVGKTSFLVRELPRKYNCYVHVLIASLREPQDFLGFPEIVGSESPVNGLDANKIENYKKVIYVPEQWVYTVIKKAQEFEHVLLVFDEFNTLSWQLQAAMLRIILEGVVGDIKLPENVHRIAIANPQDTGVGGMELPPALATRFLHVKFEADVEDFVQNFPSYWHNAPTLKFISEKTWIKTRSLVAAFIKHQPDLLFNLPNEEILRSEPWPNPRGWDMVSRVLTQFSADKLDDIQKFSQEESELLISMLAGCVGAGASNQFVTWLNNKDLVDPEIALSRAKTIKLPEESDKLWTLVTGAVHIAAYHIEQEKNRQKRLDIWNNALILSTRAGRLSRDIAVYGISSLLHYKFSNKSPAWQELPLYLKGEHPDIDVDILREINTKLNELRTKK